MKEAHKERNKLFKHKELLKSTIKSISSNIIALSLSKDKKVQLLSHALI